MITANMTDCQPSSSAPTASKKPEIAYKLRDIKYHELPAMARVMSLAFWDDQLFGEMIHPGRGRYPNDSDLYWLRDARVNFWNRRYKFLAAIVQDPDALGKEKVIGIAQWERLGNGAQKRDLARYDPSMFLYLSALHSLLNSRYGTGVPSVDISKLLNWDPSQDDRSVVRYTVTDTKKNHYRKPHETTHVKGNGPTRAGLA